MKPGWVRTSIDSTELVPNAGFTVPTNRDIMISSSVRLVRYPSHWLWYLKLCSHDAVLRMVCAARVQGTLGRRSGAGVDAAQERYHNAISPGLRSAEHLERGK